MLARMKPIPGENVNITIEEYEDAKFKSNRLSINNAFNSVGIERRDDPDGDCKALRFDSSRIHFAYEGFSYNIDGINYSGRLYLSPWIAREDFGKVVLIYWTIQDFIRLINCSISLKQFLNNSAFIFDCNHVNYLIANKNELIEAIINDIYIDKRGINLSLY